MGVYIKGMKMPSSCDECNANYDCYCCSLISGDDGHFFRNGKFDTSLNRLPHCPLVEVQPHGRLIDADALMKKGIPLSFSVQKWVDEFDIVCARTIIESEE